MNPNELFQNKLALVTGASSGIGYELAKELHSRGSNVWLVARRTERLAELAAELNQRRANSCKYSSINLTSEGDRSKLIDEINQTEVEIFVSNAGRGSFGEFATLPVEGESEIVA